MKAFFLIFVLAAPPAALSAFGRSQEKRSGSGHPSAFQRSSRLPKRRPSSMRTLINANFSAMIRRRRPDKTDRRIAGMKQEIASLRTKIYENRDFILAAVTAFENQMRAVAEDVDKTNSRLEMAVVDCPSAWTRLRHDLCIRAFDDRVEWRNASAICRNHNASLLTFRDEAEYKDSHRVLGNKSAQPRCLWIGALFDRKFVRYDDGKNTYSPRLYGSSRDGDCVISCSAMGRVKVGRFGCHYKRPFVCRKQLP